jgi:paraquat-inducible protein B
LKAHEPTLKKARSISPIWIVPIAALLVAAWLALTAWQQQGQQIEIIFDRASGIEVGKTQIRLKDVTVGKITSVTLSDDLTKVRVLAVLDRQVSQHLSEFSRFWLVSPRISTTGVSNLGTLVSGVYIVMEPGKPGEFQSSFQGLSEPPTIASDDQGTQFVLQAETLGSLDIGSPVYFRELRVGEVTSYKLSEKGSSIELRIFIDAPHDKLVETQSRFWNVSGIDVRVGADGVKAKIASIASLISGGITFENGSGLAAAERAPADHSFYLYADRDSVLEERFTLEYFYRLKFSNSVRGLSVGAPVEFRGMKVGNVVDVQLNSVDDQPESLHVFVSMQPQRLQPDELPNRETFDLKMADLVAKGMRAQMKTANLLTGAKYVDLSFPRDVTPALLVASEKFSDIPTMTASSDDLDQQVASIAKKIDSIADNVNAIPLERIGTELAQSMASLNQVLSTLAQADTAQKVDSTLANLDRASAQLDGTLKTVESTLKTMSQTLVSVDSLLAPDSKTQYELNQTFRSLQNTVQTLSDLLEKLNRKPDALIFGNDDEK